jgi:hydroxymethylbilane synthase
LNQPASLIIGTRGSRLALAQVALVRQALHAAAPNIAIDVRTVVTAGDEGNRAAIVTDRRAGLKGMFTREIEELLLRGEVDVAVHSAKDLPGKIRAGLTLTATLPRAATEDVLLSKKPTSFTSLSETMVIATSSVRRARQIAAVAPGVQVVPIRGNVPTRLRKLGDDSEIDALVLARAGLDRLGFETRSGALAFENNHFLVEDLQRYLVPAAGQGAIALQIRSDDESTAATLAPLNHQPTFLCVRAERELLRLLDGDCDLPVGASATLDGEWLTLRALIFDGDDPRPRIAICEGPLGDPESIGHAAFSKLTEPRPNL